MPGCLGLACVSRVTINCLKWLAFVGRAPAVERRPLLVTPGLTNPMLFARDRQVCAYCGGRFLYRDLSRDHIIPASRGGRDTWMNSVTACRPCNTRKGNRAPEQANMPLIYVPYVPNRHEHFILRNRRILADQMEYLLAGVPRTSRMHPLSRVA